MKTPSAAKYRRGAEKIKCTDVLLECKSIEPLGKVIQFPPGYDAQLRQMDRVLVQKCGEQIINQFMSQGSKDLPIAFISCSRRGTLFGITLFNSNDRRAWQLVIQTKPCSQQQHVKDGERSFCEKVLQWWIIMEGIVDDVRSGLSESAIASAALSTMRDW